MKVSIELPFFPGFYETDLMNSDTPYWAIKEELDYYKNDLKEEHPEYQYLTEDDLDFDYEGYQRELIDGFISGFANHAPEFVTDVEFDVVDSPRYYNFRNDRLYAFVTFADDWKDCMRKFMDDNYDWLKDRIKGDWTSYDGFMSFMENDVKDWYHFIFDEEDERYISTMIGYMMYRKNKDIRNDLIMCALEDVYAGSYVFITDDAKARFQEMIDNGEITIPDPAQLELPFED